MTPPKQKPDKAKKGKVEFLPGLSDAEKVLELVPEYEHMQHSLCQIAEIAREANRSPIRSHEYYSALFYRILKLAEGEK